jgi:alkanesulfonate monooxygenase SsuD/methylene tetrahydromethanopterin reductase-like flavin-dependent oxidoreductase (luciferase family)
MFTNEQTSFHGRRHHVDGAMNVPQPVQPGGPRILIGGGGERKTLRLVARYADMWNGFGDPDTIRHKLGVLADHCREIGRDPAEIHKTRLGTLVISATKEEAERRRQAYQAARNVSDRELPARLIWGDPGTVCDTVQTYLDIGLDGMIFNMPTGSTLEDVALAGKTLAERFGTS